MLKELQFVRGSVGKAKHDFALSHFQIRDGMVKGFNGLLSICSPINIDLDCQPDALALIKAVGNCRAAVSMKMTPGGKLSLKSGTFKAFIPCYADTLPDVEPEGHKFEINGVGFIDTLKKLAPFVSTDDTGGEWSGGILFRGKSAYATNNVILMQAWLGHSFPLDANIPHAAVKEILRINETPTHISMSESSLTVYYNGGRWLRTQLYSAEWPDVDAMLEMPDSVWMNGSAQLWDGLQTIEQFCDKLGRAYFTGDELRTSLEEEAEAIVSLPGMPEAIYNVNQLLRLREVAKKVDFSHYPAPGRFIGDKIRGIIGSIRG